MRPVPGPRLGPAPVLSQSQWPGRVEHTDWPDPGHVTLLSGPVVAAHPVSGVERVRCGRAGLRVPSLCPCAQFPARILHILSTHVFVFCRQNIHYTPLPFPGPVSRTNIPGSKASCLKVDPLLASRIFCAVMLEYGQSTNTHKHRHMLLCVFRIIACSE